MSSGRYVIDTHILLWLMYRPEKVKSYIMDVLKNPRHEVFVTSVSFWEISIKYQLGKLELYGVMPDEVPSIAMQMDIATLDINSTTMASFYKLPKVAKHKDPFDRLVIWQCIQQDYVLLSQDTKFAEYAEFGLRMLESS